MKNSKRGFIAVILLIIVVVAIGSEIYLYEKAHLKDDTRQSPVVTLPTTCTDGLGMDEEAVPVITSLSSYSNPVGAKLEIRGCNFSGFEGDLNAWIENDKGVKGILYGETGSTGKLIKVTLKSQLCQTDESYKGLPCDSYLNLIPGTYKIYTMPWGKRSNEATFTVK